MKKFTIVALFVTFTLTLFAAPADAGIFGRGRGIFRGGWGSRNLHRGSSCGSSCGAACSPAAACGPNGCVPGHTHPHNHNLSPKKAAVPAPTVTSPVSP